MKYPRDTDGFSNLFQFLYEFKKNRQLFHITANIPFIIPVCFQKQRSIAFVETHATQCSIRNSKPDREILNRNSVSTWFGQWGSPSKWCPPDSKVGKHKQIRMGVSEKWGVPKST